MSPVVGLRMSFIERAALKSGEGRGGGGLCSVELTIAVAVAGAASALASFNLEWIVYDTYIAFFFWRVRAGTCWMMDETVKSVDVSGQGQGPGLVVVVAAAAEASCGQLLQQMCAWVKKDDGEA